MLYDSLLILAVLFIAGAPLILIFDEALREGIARILFQLYLAGIVITFYLWFWTHGGQSLGMRAWRIRITDLDGGPIDARQALLRILGACLSLALCGLGYVWIIVDAQKLAWHDHLSRTRVVLMPKIQPRPHAASDQSQASKTGL